MPGALRKVRGIGRGARNYRRGTSGAFLCARQVSADLFERQALCESMPCQYLLNIGLKSGPFCQVRGCMSGRLIVRIIKFGLVGIVSFVGVASGIYVGYAYILKKSGAQVPITPTSAGPASWVNFHDGDAFPLEPFNDTAGKQGNFGDLVIDKNSILLFVTFHCDPCIDELQFYQMTIMSRLRPGVQLIVCIRDDEPVVPPEYAALLHGMTVVYYDFKTWHSGYGLTFWPAVFGVDASGIVIHQQFGFEGSMDHELANYFLKPS